MRNDTVLVYAGRGSSHSWVWLADLFDATGFTGARFVDSAELEQGLGLTPSLAIVSGGDGFEIAYSLSGGAFASLTSYIEGGGCYMGICAGAYIPLPSKIKPFSELNLSDTRIMNVRDGHSGHDRASPRESIRYGSCDVFHPVRGEVVVGDGSRAFPAPVYGGPVFCEPATDQVLLRYHGFTPRTTFQVAASEATKLMLGRPAVIGCTYGEGRLVLCGPHLEYPGYGDANGFFIRIAGLSSGDFSSQPFTTETQESTAIDRSLADLKIAILGLERESFVLGRKQWDGSRMLELANAIARRKKSLEEDTAQAVSIILDRSREGLLSAGPDGVSDSDAAPGLLVEAARITVDSHFRALRDEFILGDSH